MLYGIRFPHIVYSLDGLLPTERLHLDHIFKMVMLYVDAPSASHVVYFDNPLAAPRFISLISFTIPNSWHNLKGLGSISYEKDGEVHQSDNLIPGHYTPEYLSKALEEAFDFEFHVKVRIYTPFGVLMIEKTKNSDSLKINRELADLLNMSEYHSRKFARIRTTQLISPSL